MVKTLSYCLQRFKSNHGIIATDNDRQWLQYLIDGMGYLRTNMKMIDTCIKSVDLEVTGGVPTPLPPDFVSPLMVGACCRGYLFHFDQDDELCMPAPNCPCSDDEIQNQITACCNNNGNASTVAIGDGAAGWAWGGAWLYPAFGQPYSYSYTNGSYAIGPGFRGGGYKIDKATNTILFSPCLPVERVRLVYNGDFMNDMGNALVPQTIIDLEILEKFAEWKRRYFSPNPTVYRGAQEAYMIFYQACRDWNSNNQLLTYTSWVSLMRQYCYLQVKA